MAARIKQERAVAAQTARSRCKFRYALCRDYRHTRASRLLESESVDSSIKTVIRATRVTRHESMDAFSESPYYVRPYCDDQYHGSRPKAGLYFLLILNDE